MRWYYEERGPVANGGSPLSPSSSLLPLSQTSINLIQFFFKFKHKQQKSDPHHHQSQYNFFLLFYCITSSPPSFLFHASKLIIKNLSGIFILCYSPFHQSPCMHTHSLTLHSFSRAHFFFNDIHKVYQAKAITIFFVMRRRHHDAVPR